MSNTRSSLEKALIQSIQNFFVTYDRDHLVHQHETIRYIMFKLNEKITEVQEKQNYDQQEVRQALTSYIKLSSQVVTDARQKKNKEAEEEARRFHEGLLKIANDNNIICTNPDVVISFNNSKRRELASAELAAYKKSLSELRTTINEKFNSAYSIKVDANKFINQLESNREASEKKSALSCLFPPQPFDYKRQTINLKKTRELLENPMDTKVQKDYQQLIDSNKHDDDTKYALRSMAISAVVFAICITLCVTPAAPFALLVGACSLFAFGCSAAAAVQQKAKQYTHTSTKMAYLFNSTMRAHRQETGPDPLFPTHNCTLPTFQVF